KQICGEQMGFLGFSFTMAAGMIGGAYVAQNYDIPDIKGWINEKRQSKSNRMHCHRMRCGRHGDRTESASGDAIPLPAVDTHEKLEG
ncbi:hypothetical protein M569_06067, partial [Genlisea aurea]